VNRRVLIGGGSGLIGKHLTEILLKKGYDVRYLGRKAKNGKVKTFEWDIHNHTIDERAFEGVTHVINLAGANVNGKRWTKSYKEEILKSRTDSTKLIVDFLNNKPHQVTQFISGSAVGYYGAGNSPKAFHETDAPGKDFMAGVVVEWEKAADKLKNDKVKLAHIRTGIVLSTDSGALVEMARPIKLYVGSPLGSGKQFVPWIHIDDIAAIFMHVTENDLSGTFNAASPEPATNEEITKGLAKRIHKPLWLPNIPAFVLKVVLGDMAYAVLNGSKVSPEKIESTGYKFKYPTLESALNATLNSKL
jgi:uncharacterized protein (TIGR01777 family)